ncbi:MAG: hypothetical protein JKX85_07115, partial [Phycisphaeraceae bacterium]|nr:hypothetical protein [Phycisphaeraceae bacterium]
VSLGVFENIINKTGSTQITLTGKKEAIATGVIAIRFKIMVTGKPGKTETAYREIDIIGEPNKD